jgi:hypothetical protein
MSAEADIYEDNDYEPEFDIQQRKTETGDLELATGLTNVSLWLAASAEGDEIHADLKVPATERTEKPGTYFGIINGDKITTRLFGNPSFDGLAVYVVCADVGQNLRVFKKRKAHATRQAT